jgi:hypothetical protein
MTEPRDIRKEIADWMVRIDLAKVVRKREEEVWEKNYRAVYGEDWIGPQDIRSRIITGREQQYKYTYDKLLSFLKTEIPGLANNIPEAYIIISDEAEARNPDSSVAVEIVQGRVNTILSDMDGLDIDTRVMLADAHCALMIAKVVRINRITISPDVGEIAYVDPTTGMPVHVPEEKSDPDYDILRIDPYRFLIDERCQNNPKRALWIGEEIPKTLAELKTERLYDEDVVWKLEEKIKSKSGNKDLKDWEVNLTIYEIYDKYENKLYVICEEYPDMFLRDEVTPEGIEHNPYVIRKLCEIPGQFYGKPEISSGRVLQDDFQDGRDWQRRRARKSNPQTGISNMLMTAFPSEVKKIGDGVSDYVVMTSQNDVFPILKENREQSSSITDHMMQCSKDFDEVMGQSSLSRGMVGENKFATEAEISQLKGDQRRQDKQNQIKIFWSMIIEKLLMLIETNKSEEPHIVQALQIINPDLDIEIEIEDRSPRNMAIARKQMIEASQIMPFLQSSPTWIKNLLKTFELRDQKKILNEVMQIIQVQMQEQPKEQPKGINMSMPIPYELMPDEVHRTIQKLVFEALSKMVGTAGIEGGNGGQQPQGEVTQNESVMEGTQGMNPGAGIMPRTGEMV